MIDSIMDFLASKMTEIFIVTMFGLAFLAMAYDDMAHAEAGRPGARAMPAEVDIEAMDADQEAG